MLEGYGQYNIEKDYYNNMWTIDHPNRSKHHWSDLLGRQRTTDIQAEDASYMKIKDITLSYNLPKAFLGKWGVKGVRLSVTGTNLYTLTKYTWYDPEYSNRNPLTSGLDRFSYPMGRSVIGDITINL